MAKKKKPLDYINSLCADADDEKRRVGRILLNQYRTWTNTLRLDDLLTFMETIQNNKNRIGVAQFFGKFRAYSFEEYLYRLIQKRVSMPPCLNLFWGEKCLIRNGKGIEMDIAIGRKINQFVDPILVLDAKIELDASRLKTALASFLLLKHFNPKTTCVLAYMKKEIAPFLLDLAKPWIEKIFEFSRDKDATQSLIETIKSTLKA
ncbi:MAG: hypothetical protein QW146_07215 [Candidatus Bathyarchaeia archaeon]